MPVRRLSLLFILFNTIHTNTLGTESRRGDGLALICNKETIFFHIHTNENDLRARERKLRIHTGRRPDEMTRPN